MLREDIVHQPVAYIPVIVARRSLAPATLLVLAASGSSRAAPASDQFPSQTDVVRIQISVVDSRGRPVLDLTQQDFEITEKGRKQTITFVERSGLPEETSPDAVSRGHPIHTPRLNVIVVDDAHLRQPDIRRALLAVRAIVDSAGDGDELLLLAPMARLEAAAEMPAGRETILERAESLRSFWGTDRSSLPRFPSELRVRRQMVIDTLHAALDRCAKETRSKMVFLLSRGFRYATDDRANQDALLRASRTANAPVHLVDVRGLELHDGDHPPGMPLGGPDVSAGSDFMDSVALDTGGVVVRGTNDPTSAIQRLIAERSCYYTLGYTPIDPPHRGEFRRVQVRVGRKGVRVYARPGYVG